MVYLEQEFLGLVKYNKMYNNRMHFAIDYKTNSPNASNFRTVYLPSYAEVFVIPTVLKLVYGDRAMKWDTVIRSIPDLNG